MINYTQLTLLIFGLAGILLHNLIKLDAINKEKKENFSFVKYLKAERFAILIAIIIVALSVRASQEIKQLAIIGKWLGFGFVAIGYMGQSLLVHYMGKASKIIGAEEKKEGE